MECILLTIRAKNQIPFSRIRLERQTRFLFNIHRFVLVPYTVDYISGFVPCICHRKNCAMRSITSLQAPAIKFIFNSSTLQAIHFQIYVNYCHFRSELFAEISPFKKIFISGRDVLISRGEGPILGTITKIPQTQNKVCNYNNQIQIK